MKLVVSELNTFLDQQMTADSDQLIYAVRPHLYRHNNPAGSLKVQILDSNKKIIEESSPVLISSLNLDDGSAPSNFYHGYIRFNLYSPIKSGTVFYVRLKAIGYSFSESAYVAWCNDFDLNKYERTYSPSDGWRAALDVELWGIERSLRGA